MINQTELFVELNDEQAEIVSGGGGIDFTQYTDTDYLKKYDAVMSASNVQSGYGGSSVSQVNAAESLKILTGAANLVHIST